MVASGTIETPSPSPASAPPSPWKGAGLAALGAVAVALVLLERPLRAFGDGLWGPENAWHNRDFLGAWWLFWDSSTPTNGLALQNWPDGALALQHHIPNPFDGWLLGPSLWGLSFPLWWNGMQLVHHLLNVAASAALARTAGARVGGALAAGALVAGSPVMLHEIAGGRTLSGAVWPGLLALAFLLRGRGVLAGLLIGIQGLCYLYAGALFGLVALMLRPLPGLAAVALPMAAYAAWLWPLASGLHGKPPPAGFTELPLQGLLGLDGVPERFRLHPGLLAGLPGFGLVMLRGDQKMGMRWLAVVMVTLLVAIGPTPGLGVGEDLFTSPLAWLMWALPGAGRMHHPLRAALLLVPLLAVGVSLLLARFPARLGAIPVVLVFLGRSPVEQAVPWGVEPGPPGADAVAFLSGAPAGAVVDLTGAGDAALGLQPLHGRAMLEGLRRPTPPRRGGGTHCATTPKACGWLVAGGAAARPRGRPCGRRIPIRAGHRPSGAARGPQRDRGGPRTCGVHRRLCAAHSPRLA
ncbi:MAG: hypothetical protein VX265_12255 [Myxococcota bacterium]|nr:hypothetical protein [Myxococcota bacterium]